MKESELKTGRNNRPIQKSKLETTDCIDRYDRQIESVGIGRSINRTLRRPPLFTSIGLAVAGVLEAGAVLTGANIAVVHLRPLVNLKAIITNHSGDG
jgi:hypothetical protein